MANVMIKPATIVVEGKPVLALVRDPVTFIPLKADGENKPRSQYWLRRLRDGDVIEVKPEPVAAAG